MLGPQAKRLAVSLRAQTRLEDTGGRRAAPQYHKKRGDKSIALAIATDAGLRSEAMDLYRRDMRSAGDTSGFNWVPWLDLHLLVVIRRRHGPGSAALNHRQDRSSGMPAQGIRAKVRAELYRRREGPALVRGLPPGHHA